MTDLISYSDFTKIEIRLGTIKLKGLTLVYFITFFYWINDNDSSLEKTMTALDKNLDQAEKFGKLFL